MKKLKVLWRIIKLASLDKILYGFILFFLVCAGVFFIFEPGIENYGDALWYSFVAFTTIGFGDFVSVCLIGRVFTILLTIYGIFNVALMPGIVDSYYQEVINIKAKDNITEFLTELERLPELSKEKLEEISEKIKNKRYKL